MKPNKAFFPTLVAIALAASAANARADLGRQACKVREDAIRASYKSQYDEALREVNGPNLGPLGYMVDQFFRRLTSVNRARLAVLREDPKSPDASQVAADSINSAFLADFEQELIKARGATRKSLEPSVGLSVPRQGGLILSMCTPTFQEGYQDQACISVDLARSPNARRELEEKIRTLAYFPQGTEAEYVAKGMPAECRQLAADASVEDGAAAKALLARYFGWNFDSQPAGSKAAH